MSNKRRVTLGIFEKYLTVWIVTCIIAGLLLGRFFPAFGQLSIPIGICLFFMMYPTVVGIRWGNIQELVQVGD